MPDVGPEEKNLTYSAPVLCVDLPAFDEDGAAHAIWPCHVCAPWHAEVVIADDGAVLMREWHAADCPEFHEVLQGE